MTHDRHIIGLPLSELPTYKRDTATSYTAHAIARSQGPPVYLSDCGLAQAVEDKQTRTEHKTNNNTRVASSSPSTTLLTSSGRLARANPLRCTGPSAGWRRWRLRCWRRPRAAGPRAEERRGRLLPARPRCRRHSPPRGSPRGHSAPRERALSRQRAAGSRRASGDAQRRRTRTTARAAPPRRRRAGTEAGWAVVGQMAAREAARAERASLAALAAAVAVTAAAAAAARAAAAKISRRRRGRIRSQHRGRSRSHRRHSRRTVHRSMSSRSTTRTRPCSRSGTSTLSGRPRGARSATSWCSSPCTLARRSPRNRWRQNRRRELGTRAGGC